MVAQALEIGSAVRCSARQIGALLSMCLSIVTYSTPLTLCILHECIPLIIKLIADPLNRHVDELISLLDGADQLVSYACRGVVHVNYLGAGKLSGEWLGCTLWRFTRYRF